MRYDLLIDGAVVASETELHDLVAALPGVPEWYGRNLAALNDTLTGLVDRPVDVTIRNPASLRRALGADRYELFLSVLEKAAESTKNYRDGPWVTLRVQPNAGTSA